MEKVTYEVEMVDGTVLTGDRRPVHLLRAERLVATMDHTPGMQEQAFLIVWAACTGGTGTFADFEAWTDEVAEWGRLEAEADPPASGSDTSPG